MKYERIFLIGFMGAGKSTYGRQLAELLDWYFIDTDEWIEQESGKTIPEIFSEEGESTFRQWETKALESGVEQAEAVVATGGGLPINPKHQELIRAHGLVIWLNPPWETLLTRLQTMKDRPLVDQSEPDWETQQKQLYESRLSTYRCAHLIINPDQWAANRLSKWLLL